MASSTPTSSPVRQVHNPHPYSIKTTQTGLLTRSNSSKAHGSWSKHHYTPAPHSPSAFVFDPPESSPSPTRRHAHKLSSAQSAHAPSNHNSSQRSDSMSSSPSKYSKAFVGYDSDGEQVKLPRHPYLWTPGQLATYLSSELNGSDGEPLDSSVVKDMIDFIKQRKIGGRAFFGFDQEDFQEMEGIDSVWSNALWDASCTLRQNATPCRPSRISSAAYKRGRVKGIVDVFERSASESSDVGEDDAHSASPGKAHFRGLSKPQSETLNQDWDMSESDGESGVPDSAHARSQRIFITTNDLAAPYETGLPAPATHDHDVMAHNGDPHLFPVGSDVSGVVEETPLTIILPSRAGAPNDFAPGSVETHNDAVSVEPGQHGNTTNNTREVEIISIPSQEGPEPTVAELYAQTYGVLPPSPHIDQTVPFSSDDPSDDEAPGETVKIDAPAPPSPYRPPTALRPIARRKVSSPPPGLKSLFIPPAFESSDDPGPQNIAITTPPQELKHSVFVPSSVPESSGTEVQRVYVLPAGNSDRDEAAQRSLDTLKDRLEIVERRLEEMEKREAEGRKPQCVAFSAHAKSDESAYVSFDDAFNDYELGIRNHYDESIGGEAQRTWQSPYILLMGATTGISVVLIPLLLRHLWTR